MLLSIVDAVDAAQAALDSLAQQLYRYVKNKTVVAKSDLERYGVRACIEAGALATAGGPELRSVKDALEQALMRLHGGLKQLVDYASDATEQAEGQSAKRLR